MLVSIIYAYIYFILFFISFENIKKTVKKILFSNDTLEPIYTICYTINHTLLNIAVSSPLFRVAHCLQTIDAISSNSLPIP